MELDLRAATPDMDVGSLLLIDLRGHTTKEIYTSKWLLIYSSSILFCSFSHKRTKKKQQDFSSVKIIYKTTKIYSNNILIYLQSYIKNSSVKKFCTSLALYGHSIINTNIQYIITQKTFYNYFALKCKRNSMICTHISSEIKE